MRISTLGSGQITYDHRKVQDQNENCSFTIISQDPCKLMLKIKIMG